MIVIVVVATLLVLCDIFLTFSFFSHLLDGASASSSPTRSHFGLLNAILSKSPIWD